MNKFQAEVALLINAAKIIRAMTDTEEQFDYWIDKLVSEVNPPRAEEKPPDNLEAP